MKLEELEKENKKLKKENKRLLNKINHLKATDALISTLSRTIHIKTTFDY